MSTPVRFGLIGAGRWGRTYLRTIPVLADRCQLTHLCTRTPQHAELVPYPVAVTSDWKTLIDSNCDAVIITTPPDTHAEILEACLEAGKPCIVEKPLCLDLATAERLHQRIKASSIPILVDHAHLFNPAYDELKRAVGNGGEPVRLIVSEGMGLGPFRSHTPALWDWAPHDFSLCLDLLGRMPQRIETLGGPRSPQGVVEAVSVRLDFPGDVCAWVQVGGLSLQKRRTLSVFTETRLYLWDNLGSERLTVAPIAFSRRYDGGVPEPLQRSPIPPTSGLPPMVSMITYFLDGLAGGDRRYFGTELALNVTRLLAQCDVALRRAS